MQPIKRRESLSRQGSRAAAVLLPLLLLSAGRGEAAETDPIDPPVAAAAEDASLGERLAGWKRGRDGLQVVEPLLAERIARLRQDSPSFDRAWRRLERSGAPIVIGTREQIAEVLPSHVRRSDAWAGITVSWGGGELERSAVGIRLEWLRELHDRFGNSESVFLEALDGLLIHEIYGHLVPVVDAGSPRKHCADPGRGERLADSCVGKRELALQSERRQQVAARLAAEMLEASPSPQH